ncbi:hypothetical protein T01_11411 [Trichinella spiralis]|uniref:Uncharacterized protein n=1 Tax=Trichinella spiralis TaxID=6334 RepID=A0A0V1AHW8_TRISP|nr:hypothetical protein T01_11411 [Trichinella spiralis]
MLGAMPPAKCSLCFRQIICKYLPSGYAWGYASGKIFVNLRFSKKIAPGYALSLASGRFRIRPRLGRRAVI